MDKYTFITNYQYGEKTDVLQIDAVSMKVAMTQWADALKFPHILMRRKHICNGTNSCLPNASLLSPLITEIETFEKWFGQ